MQGQLVRATLKGLGSKLYCIANLLCGTEQGPSFPTPHSGPPVIQKAKLLQLQAKADSQAEVGQKLGSVLAPCRGP